ncbi:MAG TPA: lysoplasmalogenase, partial [Acidimicrobiales bacterium]|nr:lysoplasmalogenase [Acidimicrobiales bacterium]
ALTGLCALVEWWATHNDRKSIRYVTKPLTLVLLIGVAVTLDPTVSSAIHWWMVAGLVLSLAGDIFLLLSEKWFLAGLGSFLLGHIAYVVGLQLAPTSLGWSLVGLAVVLVSVIVVGRLMLQRVDLNEAKGLIGPVIAYVIIISAMVVSAFGTAAIFAIVGALLFYISDGTLAWNRFAEKRRWGPLSVMVTYHLGQFGLVAWLVTG